jgi:chitinase
MRGAGDLRGICHALPALLVLATTACGSSPPASVGDAGSGAFEDEDAGIATPKEDGLDAALGANDSSTRQSGSGGASDAMLADVATLVTEGGTRDGSPETGTIFSPYKDTSINMNWNTNVVSTLVSGVSTSLAADMMQNGLKTISLAFATGECASESWGGVAPDAMASANVPRLEGAGVSYVVSTGGANGSFTCGSDSGMETFLGRWASSNLVGVDFDIEAGDQALVSDLVRRIPAAHAAHPGLRFSLTLATLGASPHGATAAQSMGASAPDNFSAYGDYAMAAAKAELGFTGAAGTWPDYVAINLMTMDYGSASEGNCVVVDGACEMGQSAIQAAYNLHDHWGVPYRDIEITPMIGGNDTTSEQFTLPDADAVAHFAISQGLAGVHYWSYDRDTDCSVAAGGAAPDCSTGSASPTRSSMGSGYGGPHGYMKRFLGDGLE